LIKTPNMTQKRDFTLECFYEGSKYKGNLPSAPDRRKRFKGILLLTIKTPSKIDAGKIIR